VSLFSRAEQSAAELSHWKAFHPIESGPWTVDMVGPLGERRFLAYDPLQDSFEIALPQKDPLLWSVRTWMERGTLLSYRVGRKATLAVTVDATDAYAKVLTEWKVNQLRSNLLLAQEVKAAAGDGFPRFAPVLRENRRVVVFGKLSGRSLQDVLVRDQFGAPAALDAAARSLARFHEVEVSGVPGDSMFRQSDPDYLAGLVAAHFPEHLPTYHRALHRLSECGAPRRAVSGRLVHNDLHDRNIVLCGQEVALLDLEYLGAGDPMEDISNLSAHLLLRSLQRGADPQSGMAQIEHFLNAYGVAGGEVDPGPFAASTARSLYRLSCLYLFRRRWQHLAPKLQRCADDWIDLALERSSAPGIVP
jgi:phosphotransferase family enzyme